MRRLELAKAIVECVEAAGAPMIGAQRLIIDHETSLLAITHSNGVQSVIVECERQISGPEVADKLTAQRMRLDNSEGRKQSLDMALGMVIEAYDLVLLDSIKDYN
jgi:hypothetical protein